MLELSHHNRNHFITTIVDGSIFTSNHMFGRAIWDKLPKCIFENLEIFKNLKGDLSEELPKPKMWLLVNHTKHFA